MLDDTQRHMQEDPDAVFVSTNMGSSQTYGDPFGCPGCASVFAEVLRLAEIDLIGHAQQMPRAELPGMPMPLLIENARIITMDARAPNADTLFIEDGIDPSADVIAAGEECGSRRGTDRSPGMEVGEAHAFGGQLVEDRGLHGAAVASDVAIAQVVS